MDPIRRIALVNNLLPFGVGGELARRGERGAIFRAKGREDRNRVEGNRRPFPHTRIIDFENRESVTQVGTSESEQRSAFHSQRFDVMRVLPLSRVHGKSSFPGRLSSVRSRSAPGFVSPATRGRASASCSAASPSFEPYDATVSSISVGWPGSPWRRASAPPSFTHPRPSSEGSSTTAACTWVHLTCEQSTRAAGSYSPRGDTMALLGQHRRPALHDPSAGSGVGSPRWARWRRAHDGFTFSVLGCELAEEQQRLSPDRSSAALPRGKEAHRGRAGSRGHDAGSPSRGTSSSAVLRAAERGGAAWVVRIMQSRAAAASLWTPEVGDSPCLGRISDHRLRDGSCLRLACPRGRGEPVLRRHSNPLLLLRHVPPDLHRRETGAGGRALKRRSFGAERGIGGAGRLLRPPSIHDGNHAAA